MKQFKVIFMAAAVLAMAFVLYAQASDTMDGTDMKDTDTKGMTMGACGMMSGPNCPFCVKGAVVRVVNTKDGIQVLVTSADKSAVKEIQEKGAKFAATCANGGGAKKSGSAAAAVKETTMDGDPDETVQCPVMGTKIKKKDAVAVMEYKGKKYYFCCKMCPGQFRDDPEKYAK